MADAKISALSELAATPEGTDIIAIVDDPAIDQDGKAGLILSTLDYQKNVLAHVKGDGSAYDGTLEWHPTESIKTRYGLSLYFTNVKAGSVCVYVR